VSRAGRSLWLLVIVLSALAIAGCARSRRGRIAARQTRQLRQLAAVELACHPDTLRLVPLDDRVYQVEGCNQLRDYALADRRGRGRRGGWYAIQPVYARATAEMACPPSQLAIQAPAATVRNAHGCGRTARYDLVCGEAECAWMMTAHAGAWAGEPAGAMPAQIAPDAIPSAGAEVVVTAVPTPASPGPVGGPPTSAAAAAATPPATPVAAGSATSGAGVEELAIPEAPAAGSPEELVRALLDAQRAAIHRCTGPSMIVVRASWDAAGALSLSLSPPHAGTDVERCVQSALRSQRVPPGAPGEIAHPVR
jgi:hypothetical protein